MKLAARIPVRGSRLWLSLLVCLGSCRAGHALARDWSNLWSTPEQRAQRLLDAGRPLEAAKLFRDPRRRAYAQLAAGRYADAARMLKPYHDVDSEYNRGNALARTGDLPSALASYDAALSQAPDDREVRHNRDLVARALAQRSPQQSGQSGAPQHNGSQQQGANGQSQNGGSQSGASGQQKAGDQAGSPMGDQSAGSSTGAASPGHQEDEAKRDAALAAELKRRANQQTRARAAGTASGRGNGSGADLPGRGQVAGELDWPPPKSEQTLALEQWLRRIPEDPGGLLRRKFLIEHIERHQGTEP
ncbi:MAG TPA: tetratricopeptide repeat protein [Steroidobacteraceae bacterium]|nr:tetratricopeptide repeat protein [Steroidobacteraceae bacterium]